MKKLAFVSILLLGALAMTFAADLSISVSSPYLATQWCIGKNLNIQWSIWGNLRKLGLDPGYQQLRIMLASVGGGMRPLIIAENVPPFLPNNTAVGSFTWPIPAKFTPGEYRIRVMTMNKLVKGESEVFTIQSCFNDVRMDPLVKRKVIENAVLSIGRIAGRVSASTQGNLIAGRKVRVLLKKAGATVISAEYTLDAQGGADYQFTHLLMGTYEVSVEKVSIPMPGDSLNMCFKGTTPTQRTVVIAGGSTDVAGQDFAILYDIAFNMVGLCW